MIHILGETCWWLFATNAFLIFRFQFDIGRYWCCATNSEHYNSDNENSSWHSTHCLFSYRNCIWTNGPAYGLRLDWREIHNSGWLERHAITVSIRANGQRMDREIHVSDRNRLHANYPIWLAVVASPQSPLESTPRSTASKSLLVPSTKYQFPANGIKKRIAYTFIIYPLSSVTRAPESIYCQSYSNIPNLWRTVALVCCNIAWDRIKIASNSNGWTLHWWQRLVPVQTFGTPPYRLCSFPIQCHRTAMRMHRIRIATPDPISASALPPLWHCCTSYRDPVTMHSRIRCCALWRRQSNWSNGPPLQPCTSHANKLGACNHLSVHTHTSPCPIASICHTK